VDFFSFVFSGLRILSSSSYKQLLELFWGLLFSFVAQINRNDN
jgi:hypothetical protein